MVSSPLKATDLRGLRSWIGGAESCDGQVKLIWENLDEVVLEEWLLVVERDDDAGGLCGFR